MSKRMGVFNPREDERVNAIPQRAWDGMAPTDPDDVYGKMEMRMNRPRKPRRPAWAESGSFAAALSALERFSEEDNVPAQWAHSALVDLDQLRVIRVPKDQVDALPFSGRSGPDGALWPDLVEEARQVKLPFPVVYVDLGGALIFEDHNHVVLSGAFLSQGDHRHGALDLMPVVSMGRSAPFFVPGVGAVHFSDHFEHGFQAYKKDRQDQHPDQETWNAAFTYAVARVLEVALFMQSVNVEIAETPMSARTRERQINKGRNISLTVQVRQQRRRVSASSGGSVNFSHRFEVRGHYTHHFETKPDGTPNKVFERYANKHPDKVMSVGGQPCVRFWTPPYVKGPVNKPFVPKVRVLDDVPSDDVSTL
jgi:hypothetical protein